MSAVAKNDEKWCLVRNTEVPLNFSLGELLQGDGIDILMPQQDRKIRKVHSSIVDLRWRSLADL
jgi:hypothetical protein